MPGTETTVQDRYHTGTGSGGAYPKWGTRPVIQYSGKCNYQDKAKTIYTADKKLVQITGSALFPGDICPELSVISGGKATVFGAPRRILEGRKARNPDGTVNYTEVLLI